MSLLQTVRGFLDLSSEIYCLSIHISILRVCAAWTCAMHSVHQKYVNAFIFLLFVACAFCNRKDFMFLLFVACAAVQGRLTSLQPQHKSRQGSLGWWRREQPSDLSKTPWEFFSLILFQLQAKLIIHNCSLTSCISYKLFHNKCYTWYSE